MKKSTWPKSKLMQNVCRRPSDRLLGILARLFLEPKFPHTNFSISSHLPDGVTPNAMYGGYSVCPTFLRTFLRPTFRPTFLGFRESLAKRNVEGKTAPLCANPLVEMIGANRENVSGEIRQLLPVKNRLQCTSNNPMPTDWDARGRMASQILTVGKLICVHRIKPAVGGTIFTNCKKERGEWASAPVKQTSWHAVVLLQKIKVCVFIMPDPKPGRLYPEILREVLLRPQSIIFVLGRKTRAVYGRTKGPGPV